VIVKHRFFSRPAYLIGVLVLLIGVAYTSRRPVWIHLFAETDCACGEYHPEVTGWIVRNPFRDRAPELAASRYLDQLRRGQCSGDPKECEYDLEHRASNWKLGVREDRDGRALLYYRLTKYGVTEPEHSLTGEGLVEVARVQGAWKVVFYSSYF
jgi:hypothetical protein